MRIVNKNNPRASQYQRAYLADYDFERVMVHYRRRLLIERLELHRPEVIVEIGCGSELLFEHWLDSGGHADHWIIVEPAHRFALIARESQLPNLHVLEDFFENVVARIQSLLPREPDLVICSCLLHEVPDSAKLLEAIRAIMGKASILHLNVPNAASLHRQLAKAMGLIDDLKAMSSRNVSLMQHRVYDQNSLHADVVEANLRVIESGAYLLKPFTHDQMKQVAPLLGDAVMDGLFQLGKEFTELSSEIWVEALADNLG